MTMQSDILQLYKRDIAQYDRNNKLYIEDIFSLIPPELNAKNKRFILKNLNENAKFVRYQNSFLWLKNATSDPCSMSDIVPCLSSPAAYASECM